MMRLRSQMVCRTYYSAMKQSQGEFGKIVDNRGLHDYIFDVVVPMEEQIEIKDGRKKATLRKIFPYVLVKMIMTTNRVRGEKYQGSRLLGPGSKPVPLSDEEVRTMESKNSRLCWTMRSMTLSRSLMDRSEFHRHRRGDQLRRGRYVWLFQCSAGKLL